MSRSKNGLQPQLMRYNVNIDSDAVNKSLRLSVNFVVHRHYDMKRHAAKKEQKTVDASEKVRFKDLKIFHGVKTNSQPCNFDVVYGNLL